MTTSTTLPLPNEFNDNTEFWQHPNWKNYEANRFGVVRNIETKNEVGTKNNTGYYQFTCHCCGKNKKHLKHRFIYECFHGLIKYGYVIDHINNIHSDNRLENLQMITQSENFKKGLNKVPRQPPKRVKAINVKTGEIYIYKSISGASKDLHIHKGSICSVLSGMTKTALSKKYGERYTFLKIYKDSEITSTVIIIKNKINIPIEQVRKMIVNNNS